MNDSLFDNVYNPDVLSCLANLSNDEVFTPPEVVNKMLDMLPEELFQNPDTKFLDPACKTGVFLREIAKRLIKGLEPQIPDLQERIDHIFQKQLYGIAITELTSLLSRRGVYCSKYPNSEFSVSRFDNAEGNIRFKRINHTWKDGKCSYCGANKEQYERGDVLETHAYELIHKTKPEEIFNMKFDVIIGNPPYQLTTNTEERAAAKQAKPIFNLFVEQSKKLKPRYLSMIIPARWYSGGIGLSEFRDNMINDPHVNVLVDYVNSRDCFTGVDIAGGICYFLWDRDNTSKCKVVNISGDKVNTAYRDLDAYGDIFIRSNESIPIIEKVTARMQDSLESQVSSLDPFGFPSSARGNSEKFDGCVSLIHSQGIGYVKPTDVRKNFDLIEKWKVIIGKVVPSNGEVGIDPEKGYRAITKPRLLSPGEVNTFSYVLLGAFDTRAEAENFIKYLMCKFPRFLLRLTYSSMNIAKSNFVFVPKLNFKEEWTDEKLYAQFDLSPQEIDLIEKTIRLFDDNGGES